MARRNRARPSTSSATSASTRAMPSAIVGVTWRPWEQPRVRPVLLPRRRRFDAPHRSRHRLQRHHLRDLQHGARRARAGRLRGLLRLVGGLQRTLGARPAARPGLVQHGTWTCRWKSTRTATGRRHHQRDASIGGLARADHRRQLALGARARTGASRPTSVTSPRTSTTSMPTSRYGRIGVEWFPWDAHGLLARLHGARHRGRCRNLELRRQPRFHRQRVAPGRDLPVLGGCGLSAPSPTRRCRHCPAQFSDPCHATTRAPTRPAAPIRCPPASPRRARTHIATVRRDGRTSRWPRHSRRHALPVLRTAAHVL